MNEDLAAYIRLAVTIALLASLVTVILNLAIMTNSYFSNFNYNASILVNNAVSSIGNELQNQERITAPLAYKFIINKGELIKRLILYDNAILVSNDYETVLKYLLDSYAGEYVKLEYYADTFTVELKVVR